MKELTEQLVAQCNIILAEAAKKESKAGHARIRKATLAITKIGKEYRKASLEADKA